MSTYSSTASTVGFVKSAGSSSWTKGKAFQGQYNGYSGTRVGAFLFSDLRDVNWANQTISQITLALTYSAAGNNTGKYVQLYAGTKNSLTGSGSNMLGSLIGRVSSNGNAYNATRTITFNSSTNASAFNNFVEFLQEGSTLSLAIHNGEIVSSTAQWTTNYLCVTKAVLTVTYEIAGSTGRISPNPQELGARVHCYITPISVSGSIVKHTVQWKCGERQTLARYVSGELVEGEIDAQFIIPENWVSEFDTVTSMPAECILTTYVDDTKRGSQTYSFTIVVPQSMYPTFSYTVSPSENMQDYYQFLNAVNISIINATGQQGASIVEYSITGSEDISYSSQSVASYTTPKFNEDSTHKYSLSVTDSRGAISTKEVSITVNELPAPTISSFVVRRYASRIDDLGNVIYYESPSGGYVWVTATAAVNAAGGNNTITSAYILWGQAEGALSNRVNLSVSSTQYSQTQNRGIITAQIPVGNAYVFELHIADKHYNVTAYSRVDKSIVPVHVAGSGFGVGLGTYSDGTENDPKIQTGWPIYAIQPIYASEPIYANGGIYDPSGMRLDTSAVFQLISDDITTLGSQFTPYWTDQYPTVLRAGFVCQLYGVLKPTAELTSDANNIYNMFTLPEEYWPATPLVAVMQGSGVAVWTFRISTDGTVTASRYRNASGYTNFTTGSWLPFHATWISIGAI